MALTEAEVEAGVEVVGEEERKAMEGVKEQLGDLVVVGSGYDVVTQAADEDDVGGGGKRVPELKKKRVMVKGKGPTGAVGPAAGTKGEVVGNDNSAGAAPRGCGGRGGRGRRGGEGVGVRIGVGEGRYGGRGDDARRASDGTACRRRIAGSQFEEIGVRSRRHRLDNKGDWTKTTTLKL